MTLRTRFQTIEFTNFSMELSKAVKNPQIFHGFCSRKTFQSLYFVLVFPKKNAGLMVKFGEN